MHRICVYAGSSPGAKPEYREAARSLGIALVDHGFGLVYGGGSVGLMGTIADAVLAHGGEAIGVIPQGLFRQEIGHSGLTQLREVGSMHERKALMAELSDGFIALPGGLGTFDELFEMVTWAQLGIHKKPVALLNTLDYFNPLLSLIAYAIEEGFVRAAHKDLLFHSQSLDAVLTHISTFCPPAPIDKWTELPPAP